MARLPIIVAPDPFLKQVAKPVDGVDDTIRTLMDDMLETMYDANGIGLAAPQVGISQRVIVLDVAPKDEKPEPIKMANPEIIEASDDVAAYEEGCLSLPEQYAPVVRPKVVTIAYLDENDTAQEIKVDGLFGTCIQHEIDHLDGILFVDHISSLKRSMILRRLRKSKRLEADA